MPEINLDVPVIIDSEQALTPDKPPPIFEQPRNTEITKIVRRSLVDSNLKLPYNERRKIYYAAQKKIRDLFTKGPSVLLDSNRITKELNKTVKDRVKRILEAKEQDTSAIDRLSNPLSRQLKDLLLAKLMQTERLQVKVASADIKEYGDPENLVKIRISISEDSFEIVADDNEEMETYRLVPE